MKENIKDRKFIVATNIVSMDRGNKNKPPTITFAIRVPDYFGQEEKDKVQRLFDKLLAQQMGGDVKIMGLSLVYREED